EPPYSIDADSLFITYFASAELWCHKSLGWNLPKNLIDLHVEFFHTTNGKLPKGSKVNLLNAMAYYGLPAIASDEKDRLRDLILNSEEWDQEQREEILA